MKEKIAFVDHSFHQKTKAFNFFRTLLSKKFAINDLWDNAWQGGEHVPLKFLKKYKNIVFGQSISSYKDLKQLKVNLVWLPMYDSETVSPYLWDSILYYKLLATLPLKVICFSKKLFNWFSYLGLQCLSAQYYPNPENYMQVNDFQTKRIFFWDRGDISFEEVKKIIGQQKIDQLILKVDYDPDRLDHLPTKSEIKKYHIRIIQGHLLKENYDKLLSEANIFIAPRRREGIGMSFLEAIARGQCVIANNDSTMDEYIKNKINGLLVSNWDKEVDLANFEKMARKARADCIVGYQKWLKDQKRIIDFIESPIIRSKNSSLKKIGLYWGWLILHPIFKLLLKVYLSCQSKK